jgi:NADPH:quinone reductase-like Zn-dependent oxidoreductase
LTGRWAGAVDTVGGSVLSAVVRATRHFGCVVACGNVGGHELPLNVYPFILRGVTLTGVDSVMCPLPLRHEMWQRLGGPWKLDCLPEIASFVELGDLPSRVDAIAGGRIRGRLVVTIGGEEKDDEEEA